MVPVAMAYAQMAGVPPQQGLYSAILGMAVYAVFATSHHLKITTSSTMGPGVKIDPAVTREDAAASA